MKARILKKILNDTKYIIDEAREYIFVGSAYCHDIINVNKKTLNVKYTLDTFNEGEKSIDNPELLFIYKKLKEMVNTGEIQEIINGYDLIENPIKVWTYENGEIIESHTDEVGWPNVTYDGKLMYSNVYFDTKEKAIEKAISEYEAGVSLMQNRIKEIKRELAEAEELLNEDLNNLEKIKKIKN